MLFNINLLSLAMLDSSCLYMEKGKALKGRTGALGIKKVRMLEIYHRLGCSLPRGRV